LFPDRTRHEIKSRFFSKSNFQCDFTVNMTFQQRQKNTFRLKKKGVVSVLFLFFCVKILGNRRPMNCGTPPFSFSFPFLFLLVIIIIILQFILCHLRLVCFRMKQKVKFSCKENTLLSLFRINTTIDVYKLKSFFILFNYAFQMLHFPIFLIIFKLQKRAFSK